MVLMKEADVHITTEIVPESICQLIVTVNESYKTKETAVHWLKICHQHLPFLCLRRVGMGPKWSHPYIEKQRPSKLKVYG